MSVITDLIDENSSCHARIAELEARIVWLECEAQVNAVPVSEAKAQGVVIPPSPYMPGSQPTDFTDYELGEIHGRIAMWEEVKRLNAAPVQQVSVPDGWRIERRELDGSVCFIIGSPRLLGVRANTSVWESDSDPAHLLLWHMLYAAPAAPAADAWLVEFIADIERISDDYHADNIEDADVALDEMREALCAALSALAAHSAKGVV